jgi:tetratricopeptide (TPR) repeat protein
LDPSFNAATIILALPSILDVIPFISNSEQLVLLKTISKTINRFGRILDELQCLEDLPHHTIYSIFRALWTVGLLDDALAVCGQKIGYSKTVNNLLDRAFLLCDMGRIPEAIQAVQEMQSNVPDSLGAAVATEANFLPCIIQMRILRCTGRNQEAHRLLLEVNQKYCAVDSNLFDFEFCFLFTELAASWGHIGIREKSLKIAEKAVAACRRDFNDNEVERGKFALIHSLTTLSNCLAETEMKEAALAAAHEAAMIYTENATHVAEICLHS